MGAVKLSSLNEWSREAVACSVAFQRLGFGLDKMGVGVDASGKAFVTLHHGGEQFNIILGDLVDVAPDVFVGTWRDAIREIASFENDSDNVDLVQLCHRSAIWGKMEGAVKQLIARGFISE